MGQDQSKVSEKAFDNAFADEQLNATDRHARAIALIQNEEGFERDIDRGMDILKSLFQRYRHVKSAVTLGRIYSDGEIVERNFPLAAYYYDFAASKGDTVAMNDLALILTSEDPSIENDTQRAFKLFEKSSEDGDPTSMYNLARLYIEDEGHRDILAATDWFQRAADAGHCDSMKELAEILLEGGEIVEKDVPRAIRLYEKAIESGDEGVVFDLALLYDSRTNEYCVNDISTAISLYETDVAKGGVSSMNNLALLLKENPGYMHYDAERAEHLLWAAAQEGNKIAMFNLFIECEEGKVSKRDGTYWLEQAAEAKHEQAMCKLGENLLQADYERNYEKAAALFKEAAELGNSEAMWLFAVHQGVSTEGHPPDFESEREWLDKAAESGHQGALYRIGTCFEKGLGAYERDLTSAKEIYARLAEEDHSGAYLKLAELDYCGRGASPDMNQFSSFIAKHMEVSETNEWVVQRAVELRYGTETDFKNLDLAKSLLKEAYGLAKDPYSGVLLADLLLSNDANNLRDPLNARDILEDNVKVSDFGFSLHELAVLYEFGDEGIQKNFPRAAELHVRAQKGTYNPISITATASHIIGAGAHYQRSVAQIMQHGYTVPKTSLLLTLGGPARGKTCTMNSIRGLDFVENHQPTSMTDLSKFVAHPGLRNAEPSLLHEFDFNDNSLQANASRLDYDDGSEHGGRGNVISQIPKLSSNFPILTHDEALEQVRKNEKHPHADVINRVRQPILQHIIERGFEGCLVQVWDMAGQSEYEMAHSLFVSQSDILVFVTDLTRIEDETTRESEVKLLCYWMQFAHFLISDPSVVPIIIVGTRKDSCCGEVGAISLLLKRGLREHLAEPVYNCWVKINPSSDIQLKLIAIENKTAKEDPEKSGLERLERAIRTANEDVISRRGKLPVRWLAFVDKLERDPRPFFSRSDLAEISIEFPGFSADPVVREKDFTEGLHAFASTGRVIIFQPSVSELYVFTDPSRILDLVGKVAVPDEKLEDTLTKSEILGLKSGNISVNGIFSLWHGYSLEEKQVILAMLVNFDLLMRLQDDESREIIGIPARLPFGWDDYELTRAPGEASLHTTTSFEEAQAIPSGLIGILMAHLHRTMGSSLPSVKLVRADAALLNVENEGRVFVGFLRAERKLIWIFLGKQPVRLAHRSLLSFEKLIRSPIHRFNFKPRHLIELQCMKSSNGCGSEGSVLINLCDEWIFNDSPSDLPLKNVSCSNLDCMRPWSVEELHFSLQSQNEGQPNSENRQSVLSHVLGRRPFQIFISHAGPDKLRIALPLKRAFERQNIRAFLDMDDLRISRDDAPTEMRRAMREASIGIFILSPEFAARRWTMIELRHFLERHSMDGAEKPVLLPVFYRLQIAECQSFYEAQSGHHGLLAESKFFENLRQAECSTEHASMALKRIKTFSGVEVRRIGGGEPLSSAAVLDETVTRIFDFIRREGNVSL